MHRGDRIDLGEALFQHYTPSQGIPLLTALTAPFLLSHYFDLYLFHFIRVVATFTLILALFITLFGSRFAVDLGTALVTTFALWTQSQQLGAVARGQGRGIALVV